METFNGVTVAEMTAILTSSGFGSELAHEEPGLAALRITTRGLLFGLVLQGEVAKGRYGSAQCVAGFEDAISPEQMNDWNQTRRFVRVYADESGGALLEMDFLLVGITAENVQANLGIWLMSLGDFSESHG